MNNSPAGVSWPRMDDEAYLSPFGLGAGVGCEVACAVVAALAVLSVVTLSCGPVAGLPVSPASADNASKQGMTKIAFQRTPDCIWPPQSSVSKTLGGNILPETAQVASSKAAQIRNAFDYASQAGCKG